MFEQLISDFEKLILQLEDKLENNDDYFSSDEFETDYENIKERERTLNDQLAPPPDNASERQLEKYEAIHNRFEKLQKRIKKIEDEYDLEAGNDSAWMFPND